MLVTGTVAVIGVTSWRRQMVGKRKAELAEQVLVDFYEARDVFQWVRSSGFLASEGNSRKATEDEPDQVRLMRNVYFIPLERLNREKELFARLQARRYVFRAYFGDAGTEPFETLAKAHNEISVTAGLLIQIAEYDGASKAVSNSRDKLLDDLGWGKRARPDDMDRSIKKAVADIEAICRPMLEGRDK